MQRRVAPFLIALALGVISCASKANIRDAVPPPWVANLDVAPLAVESVDARASEGYHAVFIKLSRFPDSVSSSATKDPARIHLELTGPATGEDLPEERLVMADALVDAVRISRNNGKIHITLELHANEVPRYQVNEMADWIKVRLAEEP